VKSLVVLLALATPILFGPTSPLFAETIAIRNATIYQRADKKLEGATIVIRDGKIADVGIGVAAPAGANVIDGKGKIVTAGLIEASTQLGLVEVDLEDAGNDGRFGTQPTEIHAAYRSADAYDGRSVAIPVARTGGVTSAITGPAGGLVAGQAAWVSLADSASPLAATSLDSSSSCLDIPTVDARVASRPVAASWNFSSAATWLCMRATRRSRFWPI